MPGHPDYEVSDLGRVVSLKYGKRRLLRLHMTKRGYIHVSLRTDGKKWDGGVHRLAALAFLGPEPDGTEVRHLDGDKRNNRPGNLAYGTRSENTADQVRHGVHNQASKTRCRSGHPYNEANTRWCRDGSRECRICRIETKRRWRARHALSATSVKESAA